MPIADLEGHKENRHIVWEVPLPDYAEPHLAVDLRCANAIAGLGALAEVTFEPGRMPEDDEPQPGNPNSDGTLTAVRSLSWTPKKPQAEVGLHTVWDAKGRRSPFFKDVAVSIDVDGLSRRLSERGALYSPHAWASGLGRMAARGLRQAAVRNLTIRGLASEPELTATTLLFSGALAFELNYFFGDLLPPAVCISGGTALSLALTIAGILNAQREKAVEHDIDPNDVPYTALPLSLDRLARLQAAILRHRQLIHKL